MGGERQHQIVQHRHQGAGLEAHGASKPQVMFRHAERLGWRHEHATAASEF